MQPGSTSTRPAQVEAFGPSPVAVPAGARAGGEAVCGASGPEIRSLQVFRPAEHAVLLLLCCGVFATSPGEARGGEVVQKDVVHKGQ